ncbi:AEC family transporter [Pelagimonas varians]|nr:AEC family transporter [Pelagimonas varians]
MIFVTILQGLLPSFLMVILGGLLRNRLSENAWQGLDRLNFEILFPALIFVAASGRPIALVDVARIGPAVWIILGAGMVLGYSARRYGPERFLDFAGGWQVAWRFNTAMGFIAVAILPDADLGILAVAIGMGIPMANLLAVSALSRGGSLGFGATVKRIALNPFLLASVSGVLVGLSGWTIPAPVLAPIEMLSQAAIPVALISIGATMDWRALARLDRFSAILCGVRLVALPALTFSACLALDVDPSLAGVLVVFSALPTASAAHVLASSFGADRKLVATLIAQSTLLAAVTLPLWIAAVIIWV